MSDELNPVTPSVDAPVDAPVVPPTDAPVDPVVPPTDPVEAPVEVPVETPVVPAPEPEPVKIEDPLLSVDVAFDDGQLASILAAGLEPAQVRNEIGLVVIKKEEPQIPDERRLTLSEAISRAKVRYEKE